MGGLRAFGHAESFWSFTRFSSSAFQWREELNLFCEKQSGKRGDVQCCSQDLSADDRLKCFQDASPDPHYNETVAGEEPTLGKICDVHKLLKKK